MMTKVLSFTKKHPLIGIFVRSACFILMKIIYAFDLIKASLRQIGVGGNQYNRIKLYKNKYYGERCFIICTGPSLLIKDCERLQNEYTFCMNSFCKVLDNTSFSPTFYGIQDVQVYNNMRDIINDKFKSKNNVLIADRITRKYGIEGNWIVFPLCYSYNSYNRWFNNVFKAKFSDNAYRIVYDEFSITHSLIQIAIYMGFKKIYLLGADCSFSKESLHFVDHGIVDTQLNTSRDRNIAGYNVIKEYCNSNGVEVFNATRGGALEVFPRVNFDELVEKGEL